MQTGGFEGFPLEETIRTRATACDVVLSLATARSLADHARAVLDANPRFHLTTIAEPREFVERHLGEALEGAAMLSEDIEGTLLDFGSGNGYPGLPIAACRPGLRAVLAEASTKKAAFLRDVIARFGFAGAAVLERHVRHASDLESIAPVRVIASRATGGWERVLPKLASCLVEDGCVLVWAGESMERVLERAAWRKLRLVDRRPLPNRDRSWIWLLRKP